MSAPIIMVDELVPYPNAKLRIFRAGSCHLTVDGDSPEHMTALHAFADLIGCKREWFQPKSSPHYDLTGSKRRAALRRGAVFVGCMAQARARIERRKS